MDIKSGLTISGRKFTVSVDKFRNGKLLAFVLIRESPTGEIYLARHGRSGLKCFLRFADRDMLVSRHPHLAEGGTLEASGSVRILTVAESTKSATGELTYVTSRAETAV